MKSGAIENGFGIEYLAAAICIQIEIVTSDLPTAIGQQRASCHERLDDERYVTWNWCTRKEGVTFEEISAKHAEYAADMQEDSGGIIGWLVMLPHTGGADAAGEFAHVAIYPDMESFMARRSMLANGGWQVTRDCLLYTSDAADE